MSDLIKCREALKVRTVCVSGSLPYNSPKIAAILNEIENAVLSLVLKQHPAANLVSFHT